MLVTGHSLPRSHGHSHRPLICLLRTSCSAPRSLVRWLIPSLAPDLWDGKIFFSQFLKCSESLCCWSQSINTICSSLNVKLFAKETLHFFSPRPISYLIHSFNAWSFESQHSRRQTNLSDFFRFLTAVIQDTLKIAQKYATVNWAHEQVSEQASDWVSEQASEWAQRSAWVKQAVRAYERVTHN